VYTPGAAPIPHADAPGADSPRSSQSAHAPPGSKSSSDTGAASQVTAAEAAAIRAEIARRRHRVDSLRQVLDSLARKAAADSQ
jgi:hypothetical protein